MTKKISSEKLAKIVELSGQTVETVTEWLYNDWDNQNDDNHQEWIETASAAEIADWIKAGLR